MKYYQFLKLILAFEGYLFQYFDLFEILFVWLATPDIVGYIGNKSPLILSPPPSPANSSTLSPLLVCVQLIEYPLYILHSYYI